MGRREMTGLRVVLLLACVLAASATWTEQLEDLAPLSMLGSTGYVTSNCNCSGCDRDHHKLVDPAVVTTATECEAACDADSECKGSLHDTSGQEVSGVKCFLYTQDITPQAGDSSHSRFSCYKKSGTVAQISTSGMTVTQSTTRSAGGEASRAIDGNTNQNFGQNSCTHSSTSSDNWWNTRLTGSYVEVGGTNCSGTLDDSTSSGQTITCEEAGSSVKVISGNAGAFTLCEVEIFGY